MWASTASRSFRLSASHPRRAISSTDTSPGELVGDLLEAWVCAVAIGDERLLDRPLHADRRVVPGDAALGLPVVVARHLVGDVGLVTRDAEAVRKADRDECL